jgi:CRISPR system Cascade subunit CasA
MAYSLLDDPLISAKLPEGERSPQTLPQILDHLSQENVLSFEALQAHQQQAWFSFLVQLAVLAIARETGGSVPSSPEDWREALLDLASGQEPAWELAVEDLREPAFLQSPVPEGSLEEGGYKTEVPTPDQLDMLITSKNHDIKARRITRPRPEHWIYALVNLQTMEGYGGRGNYGIVRMNGGYGNRPQVGLAPELSWGQRFRRDRDVLLDHREEMAEMYDLNGHALLWLLPWDGEKGSGLPLEALDPYFLEICRRIRFTQAGDHLRCWRANTSAQRVAASDSLNGRTGDPWTPVDKSEGKALTIGSGGFNYQRVQSILLGGEYDRPPALRFREVEDGPMYLVARALARGQGKTEGLHHRILPVPPQATRWLREPSRREILAKRAQSRVERASEVRSRVLYPAIGTLLAGGRTDDIDTDAVGPWQQAFDRAVDSGFFEALWDSVQMDETEARSQWANFLWNRAQEQFRDAEQHVSKAATRYWRARSQAQSIFYGAAQEVLPEAEVFSRRTSDPVAHESNV